MSFWPYFFIVILSVLFIVILDRRSRVENLGKFKNDSAGIFELTLKDDVKKLASKDDNKIKTLFLTGEAVSRIPANV